MTALNNLYWPAVPAGLALGLLYYYGLWLTVRRLPDSANPHLLLLASFWARNAAAAAGFCLLALRGWPAAALALVSFLAARQFLVRRLGVMERRTAWTSRT